MANGTERDGGSTVLILTLMAIGISIAGFVADRQDSAQAIATDVQQAVVDGQTASRQQEVSESTHHVLQVGLLRPNVQLADLQCDIALIWRPADNNYMLEWREDAGKRLDLLNRGAGLAERVRFTWEQVGFSSNSGPFFTSARTVSGYKSNHKESLRTGETVHVTGLPDQIRLGGLDEGEWFSGMFTIHYADGLGHEFASPYHVVITPGSAGQLHFEFTAQLAQVAMSD